MHGPPLADVNCRINTVDAEAFQSLTWSNIEKNPEVLITLCILGLMFLALLPSAHAIDKRKAEKYAYLVDGISPEVMKLLYDPTKGQDARDTPLLLGSTVRLDSEESVELAKLSDRKWDSLASIGSLIAVEPDEDDEYVDEKRFAGALAKLRDRNKGKPVRVYCSKVKPEQVDMDMRYQLQPSLRLQARDGLVQGASRSRPGEGSRWHSGVQKLGHEAKPHWRKRTPGSPQVQAR